MVSMTAATAKATNVKSRQQTSGACILFALVLNCLLLQAFSEAHLASSSRYIYSSQEPTFGIELARLIGTDREGQADLPAPNVDEEELSNNILDISNGINLGGYLVADEQPVSRQNHRLLDKTVIASNLADYPSQQQRQQQSNVIRALLPGEINVHLPARGLEKSTSSSPLKSFISQPVNDPADFEAALSTFTDTINHELPNSSTRDVMLDSLMSAYLGDIVKGLHQQQGNYVETEGGESNSRNLHAGGGGSSGQSSTTPASRYGGGEYIDHPLALIGHQYVQGGAGEGKQLLGPDGTFENVQVIKTDHAVPSYCDPPNPCPVGYTAEDGCLEKFINSASFSREYQARQQCSCDNEHSLFNCASPVSTLKGQSAYSPSSSPKPTLSIDEGATTDSDGDVGTSSQDSTSPNFNSILGGRGSLADVDAAASDNLDSNNELEALEEAAVESKLDTLARTIHNRFGNLATIRNLIGHRDDLARGY